MPYFARICRVIAACAGTFPVLAAAQQAVTPPASPPTAAPASPTTPDGSAEVETRHAAARQLVKDKRPEEAAEQYAWLWENALKVDPTKAELRATFMASEMEHLAMRSEPAKARFMALRDAAEQRVPPATPVPASAPALDAQLVDDLLLLNRIVGEPERSLAWFDKVKVDPAAAATLPEMSQRLEHALEAGGRWVDLSRYIYRRPQEIAQRAVDANREALKAAARADPGKRDMLNATQERSHNARMSRMYAALLVAKRDADAEETLAIIGKGDSYGRAVLACISRGLELGEAREAMRKPLDEAWKKGAGIAGAREKLNKALKKK